MEEFFNLARVCEVKLGKSGLDFSTSNGMVIFVSELGFTQNDQKILQVMFLKEPPGGQKILQVMFLKEPPGGMEVFILCSILQHACVVSDGHELGTDLVLDIVWSSSHEHEAILCCVVFLCSFRQMEMQALMVVKASMWMVVKTSSQIISSRSKNLTSWVLPWMWLICSAETHEGTDLEDPSLEAAGAATGPCHGVVKTHSLVFNENGR